MVEVNERPILVGQAFLLHRAALERHLDRRPPALLLLASVCAASERGAGRWQRVGRHLAHIFGRRLRNLLVVVQLMLHLWPNDVEDGSGSRPLLLVGVGAPADELGGMRRHCQLVRLPWMEGVVEAQR